MSTEGQICASCGHLSPTEHTECHECSTTLGGEPLSLDELSHHFSAVETGYSESLAAGFLVTVSGLVLTGAATVVLGEGDGGTYVGLFVSHFGFALAVGARVCLNGMADNGESGAGLLSTFFIVYIASLFALPFAWELAVYFDIQYFAAVSAVLLTVAGAWLVWRHHGQYSTTEIEAVQSLAKTARSKRDAPAGDLVLALVAASPEVTTAEADDTPTIPQFGENLSATRTFAESDHFAATVAAVCERENGPKPNEVVETLVSASERLERRGDGEDATVCRTRADELAAEFDIDRPADGWESDTHDDTTTGADIGGTGDASGKDRTNSPTTVEDESPVSDDGSETDEPDAGTEGATGTTEPGETGETGDRQTRRELRGELQRLDTETDAKPYPSRDMVNQNGEYHVSQYISEFGSLETALDAAGIEVERRLREEIRRVRDEIDELPTKSQFRDYGRVSVPTLERNLGSWREAKLSVEPVESNSTTRRELIAVLREADDDVDPETERLSSRVEHDIDSYVDEFGSWRAALAAAEIDVEAHLCGELRRLDEQTSVLPDKGRLKRQSPFGVDDYVDEFGSCGAALEAAEIPVEDRLLDEIRRVRDELGEIPMESEMDRRGRVSPEVVERHFDSWSNATERVDPVSTGGEPGSDGTDSSPTRSTDTVADTTADIDDEAPIDRPDRADLIEEIKRLDDGTTLLLHGDEIGQRGGYTLSGYADEFGSWEAALETAGVDPEVRLLDRIRDLRDEMGRIPKESEMRDRDQASLEAVERHFGSWSNATLQVSPIPREGNRRTATSDTRTDGPSRGDLVAEISRLRSDETPLLDESEAGERSEYTLSEYTDEFGSWWRALETAGVDLGTRLLDELRRVRDEVGRRPSRTDVDEHAQASVSGYEYQFGSVSEASSQIEPVVETELETDSSAAAVSDGTDAAVTEETTSSTENGSSPVVPDGLATVADVPSDGSLDGPILVRVDNELNAESHLAAAFLVTDALGESLRFDVHEQHALRVGWQTEEWYLIDGARGQRGWGAEQLLTSGSDLRVKPLGSVRPDLEALVGESDASEWLSTTDETGETDGIDETQRGGGEDDSTVDGESTAADGTDDEPSTGDGELDTLLDELDDMV